eukprot:1337872-Amorphochlora_amoeboformis.AAC.2
MAFKPLESMHIDTTILQFVRCLYDDVTHDDGFGRSDGIKCGAVGGEIRRMRRAYQHATHKT